MTVTRRVAGVLHGLDDSVGCAYVFLFVGFCCAFLNAAQRKSKHSAYVRIPVGRNLPEKSRCPHEICRPFSQHKTQQNTLFFPNSGALNTRYLHVTADRVTDTQAYLKSLRPPVYRFSKKNTFKIKFGLDLRLKAFL